MNWQSIKNIKHFFSEPEARNIFDQVVSGVKYLHSRKIMHRDLALANLIIRNADKKNPVLELPRGSGSYTSSMTLKENNMCLCRKFLLRQKLMMVRVTSQKPGQRRQKLRMMMTMNPVIVNDYVDEDDEEDDE